MGLRERGRDMGKFGILAADKVVATGIFALRLSASQLRLPPMAKVRDKSIVSIWFWLLAMCVMAVPFLNLVMILVWAFTGENQSRKNYFRALIVMFLFWTAVGLVLLAAGTLPAVAEFIRQELRR